MKSDAASVEAFNELVAQPDFDRQLERAIDPPQNSDSKRLMRRVMYLLSVCGRDVPFSTSQRPIVVSRMCALIHYAGLPLWFWTISPSDVDSVPELRIAGLQFPLPSLQHRAHVIARNPAAAARAFQNLINAVFENIFGLGQQGSRKTSAPSFGTNQRRVHRCVLCGGHCVGYFGVTETQGRGALHMHGCLFCTLGPQLLQRCQADPELSSRIASVIDSVVIAGLPDDVHAEIAQRKELGLPPERVGLTAGEFHHRSMTTERSSCFG